MNTAEIAVENLVSGALGLLAFGLLFVEPNAPIASLNVTVAAAALGIAFVVGIVLDKAFDRLLGPADAWQRLVEACRQAKRRDLPDRSRDAEEEPKQKEKSWRDLVTHLKARFTDVEDGEPSFKDYLPQDGIEAALRIREAPAHYVAYMKTRIRITRAIAVTSPVIGFTAAAWLNSKPRSSTEGDTVLAVVQSLLLLPSTNPVSLLPIAALAAGLLVTFLPPPIPRTDQCDCSGVAPAARRKKGKWSLVGFALGLGCWWVIRWRPILVLYGLCAYFTWEHVPAGGRSVAVFGVGGGLLGLWAWTQMTATYLRFVASFSSLPAKSRGQGE